MVRRKLLLQSGLQQHQHDRKQEKPGECRSRALIRGLSAPESFAVPVGLGASFDLDIAVHARLARETQIVFVPESREKCDRPKYKPELFKKSLGTDVLGSLRDLDTATGALAKPHAVDVFVQTRIELNPFVQGRPAEVGSRCDLNLFFLVDELDFGHEKL
jgi:hypothetical protein